jgi:hypothetical protein
VIGVATKKAWSKRKPKVNHIKIFGYIAYKVVTGKLGLDLIPHLANCCLLAILSKKSI